MAKLSDTQLVVLSNAARRDDGLAVALGSLNKAAAVKVGASLVARKLMREIRTKPGMPVWRNDENGRPMSLVLLRAGRAAIGVNEDDVGVEVAGEAGGVASSPVASTKAMSKAERVRPTEKAKDASAKNHRASLTASALSHSPKIGH